MEKSATAKFSAYNRVCQVFIEACEKEDVDPGEALQRIARFLGTVVPPIGGSSNPTSIPPPPRPADPPAPKKVQLSKEQADQAKRDARAEKARRLNLSPQEVNLTTKEVKDAKAAMRKRIEAGLPVATATNGAPASMAPSSSEKVPGSPVTPPNNGLVEKPDRSVDQAKTGLRATAQTKLKACRKNCLTATPTGILDPKVLHLIAYHNHFNRLSQQWADFQKSYKTHGMSNPLRGLVDPSRYPEISEFIATTVAQNSLREQPDSPGTFILQDEGKSFWDRDKPSSVCPTALQEALPARILTVFSQALGATN